MLEGRGPLARGTLRCWTQIPVLVAASFWGLSARPDLRVIDLAMVRPLPRLARSLPLADALSRMRRSNSHLALVTDESGAVVAMVAMEDLVEDLVGTMRDA